MKLRTFLCLTLFAGSQVIAKSGKGALSLNEQDSALDNVLRVLQGYQVDAANDLTALNAAFQEVDPELQARIDDASQLVQDKTNACAAIQDAVDEGTAVAASLTESINNAEATALSNNEKAEAASDARCASNLLFISELGNRVEAVDFLRFLRGQVADPAFLEYLEGTGGALIQLKSALATKQENEILSLVAKHQMLSLMQVKQNYEGESNLSSELNARVRTASEVGNDYQDNDRGELAVQGVDDNSLTAGQYVEQLLGYIDELVARLESDEELLEQAETAAVQAFISYLKQLRDQNYVILKYVEAANAALAELQGVNADNQAAHDQCVLEIGPLQDGLEAAREAKEQFESSYAQQHQSLVDKGALLDQAITLYQDQVLNLASSDEKERADDYLDNQEFDRTGDYTARTPVPGRAL